MTNTTGDTGFWASGAQHPDGNPSYGIIRDRRLEPADLDAEELARAKGALAYLKARIGNDGMRKLLADDLALTTERTGRWAQESDDWKSANLKLVVPGPGAAEFHNYFLTMMREDREPEIRSAHPDHFMNIIHGPKAEVIENVGEDDLPWFIRLEFTDEESRFQNDWDPAYPEHLGALVFNNDGVHIGSAMHEMRDTDEGMEISLTMILPGKSPDRLLDGHLRHFAVEFRNWTRMARESAGAAPEDSRPRTSESPLREAAPA